MAQNYAISFKFTLLDKMTVPAKGLSATMGNLSKQANAASKNITAFKTKQASTTAGVFKGLLGFNVLTTSLNLVKTGFQKIVKEAANTEMSLAGFTTLLSGNEIAAKKLVNQLRILGARTPFEYKDLADATSMLMGFGAVTADTATDTLAMLGDLSQGSAVHLEGVARAYGQIMAGGRATMQDVNQLVNNQVPLLQQLAKQWGLTGDGAIGQARKMVEQGKATGEEVTKAFKSMTSEGGMFYQGMLRSSKTFTGAMSNFDDAISLTAAGIGEALLPTLKKLLLSMTEAASKVLAWVEANKELLSNIVSGLAGALGVIFDILAAIVKVTISIIGWTFKYRKAILPLIAALSAYKITMLAVIAVGWIKYLWMMRTAIFAAAKAQWGLNIAMSANPIGLIIAGVAALAAGVYLVYTYWDDILMALKEAVDWVLKFLGLMPEGGTGKTNLEKQLEAKKAAQALNGANNKSVIEMSVTGKDGATATIDKVNSSGNTKPKIQTNNGRTLSYEYDGNM